MGRKRAGSQRSGKRSGKDAHQSAVPQAKDDGELVQEPESTDTPQEAPAEEPLRVNTSEPLKKRPGHPDLSKTGSVPPPLPSALSTARAIDDISRVSYPEGISSPKPELNSNVKDGKFRYDCDFLLQFMAVCREKPDMLPPLDAIGLVPIDQASLATQRGGSGRHRQPSGGPSAPSRSGTIGLGFGPGPSGFGKSSTLNPFAGGGMGNFSTTGAKLTSEERFQLSTGRSASVGGPAAAAFGGRPVAMHRTPSQGVMGRERVRSQRGGKRPEKNAQQSTSAQAVAAANLEPVAPLKVSENRWDRKAIQVEGDSPEVVDRKVRGLLNKLTMERFDSISDQIIEWANKSEKEKDGRTLIQVIRLVFEKATDEAAWSEMYARLCRKMMEQISNKVQDDGIKNTEGKPIAGGQLFRKCLRDRSREDLERGWVQKEAAAAAVAKASQDKTVKAANEKKGDGKGGDDEVALHSDEYYAAQKAKRQGLGLIKFIGELFKLQMLTERFMHECVKKFLGNVNNPEEELIESLCKLLTMVGSILDTQKARAHMDVYFQRMRELTKSQKVSPRMQFMLQDVIELRDRKWFARNAVAAPTTIAQVHEAAAKEKALHEKEYAQRQIGMSRGGSRRSGDGSEQPQVNPEGCAAAGNAARCPSKVDLSNFEKISNKTLPTTLGPGSVFAGKGKDKCEPLSRNSSSANMFSMLQSAESGGDKTPEAQPQRKKLALLPRTKPIEADSQQNPESDEEEEATTPAASVEMSDEQAEKKMTEDLKEFFAVRNLEEAEAYFTALPAQHHSALVDRLVSSAVESEDADARLVADLFGRAVEKGLCSQEAFEQGLIPCAEIIDDIAIDVPKAFQLFAVMVKGAALDGERRSKLASKSMDSDKLLALLS
ncbi:hypothetical protein NP233_g4502 [Leucocoprinus birnbaumii]|uniref:MI domain-containing protein n=1 Tax=Leucocoprinus birnbaumii TaxID=56174 RepID=A0AAD5VV67_9AGAR|nr:hypothetical protein NP233_g4502 [Leucocoprinus birnbaumii]